MNRKIAFIVGCLLWLTAPGAQAQADMQLRMDSGFYIGAGIGRSESRDFCSSVAGACDDKDFSWNLFAGYQINRHFAVEAGYSDFGKATSSGFVGGAPAVISSETTAFELVGIGAVPLTDNFSLYAKAGFFRYESDGIGSGAVVGSASDKGIELTFGFGAEYGFARNWAARLEWQRYFNVGSGLFGIPNADIGMLRFATRYKF